MEDNAVAQEKNISQEQTDHSTTNKTERASYMENETEVNPDTARNSF